MFKREITKNKRNVNVENFFQNTMLFVERSRSLMSEGCFTDSEVYRLKKKLLESLVLKIVIMKKSNFLVSMVPAAMLVLGLFLFFFSFNMSNINIASLNVNGARDSKKKERRSMSWLSKNILMWFYCKRHIVMHKMQQIGQWNGRGFLF